MVLGIFRKPERSLSLSPSLSFSLCLLLWLSAYELMWALPYYTPSGALKRQGRRSQQSLACCLNLCVPSSPASRSLGLEMLAPRCGVPRFLLVLLGPMLFAPGRAGAESQGEETAGLLWPPTAAVAIIRNILRVEKWTLERLTSNPGRK